MNIIVFNGSPKGDKSFTLQYLKYIQNILPGHFFRIIDIVELMPSLEENTAEFENIIAELRQSDGVIWAFPLYIGLVHSLYKRFIELLQQNKTAPAFAGKHAIALSTSIHFSDHIAHNYIHAICDDLNMIFCGAYSAHHFDLSKDTERKRLRVFIENFLDDIKAKVIYPKMFAPLQTPLINYVPVSAPIPIDTAGKRIVILTDLRKSQNNLRYMLDRFQKCFAQPPEIINLWDIDINYTCTGCCQCGLDGKCIYHDKDNYENFYNKQLKLSDIIIFSGTITDRFLSSRWKLFFDRSFFNNHLPSLIGKQFGFIISGALKELPNLTQFFDIYSQWQQSACAGFVSDHENDAAAIDTAIESLAHKTIRASQQKYSPPNTFLGIGSYKILQDEFLSKIRFPFIQDPKNKLYNLPHKYCFSRIINKFILLLCLLPPIMRINRERIFLKPLKLLEKNAKKL